MYKVGTRVKKVRIMADIGLTGVVVAGEIKNKETDKFPYDMLVKADGPRSMLDGAPAPAGSINREYSEWWEPIIPEGSNVPSEVTIHELLDSKFYEKENCNV